MTRTTKTYYCDICGKEIELGETGTHFNGAKYFPYIKVTKDGVSVIRRERYDNLHVEEICEECHDKIASFITSLIPEERTTC